MTDPLRNLNLVVNPLVPPGRVWVVSMCGCGHPAVHHGEGGCVRCRCTEDRFDQGRTLAVVTATEPDRFSTIAAKMLDIPAVRAHADTTRTAWDASATNMLDDITAWAQRTLGQPLEGDNDEPA